MAAGGGESAVQRMQLRRRHADIDSSAGGREDVVTGSAQERSEVVAEVVIDDPLAGCALVIDVITVDR